MKKIKKKRKNREKLLIVYFAGFALSISSAFPTYVNSSFIETFVNVKFVGLFFVAANLISFFAILFFPNLIRRSGNFFSTKLMLLINVFSLLCLITLKIPVFIFIFFVSLWASSQLLWINMDLFLESFTDNLNTGRIRAIFFTFNNLGWILAPFLASVLIGNNNNYNLVYFFAMLFALFFLVVILYFRKRINRSVKYKNIKMKQVFKDFCKNKNLKGIYFSSFFLNLFYSSAVVYIPIYLHQVLGFDWSVLGVLFSIMLVPFVLVQIPAGIIADKYLGEKEMLNTGMIILILSLLLFFSVKSSSVFLWGVILFFSRIGAALVEAMRESHFFKIVDVEDVGHINFLRTSSPLGYLVGSGIAVLILSFFQIDFLFLFLAIILLSSFYFIHIIKDSK